MVDTTEKVVEKDVNRGDQHVVTRETNQESRDEHINRGTRVVWYLIGVVIAFLLVRFILALLGANLENPFASFIYAITDPFVVGFRGLLQVGQFQAGVSRFEFETVVAAAVYALIGWGITAAINLFKKGENI